MTVTVPGLFDGNSGLRRCISSTKKDVSDALKFIDDLEKDSVAALLQDLSQRCVPPEVIPVQWYIDLLDNGERHSPGTLSPEFMGALLDSTLRCIARNFADALIIRGAPLSAVKESSAAISRTSSFFLGFQYQPQP
jgi:hypothetical protein